MNEPTATQLGLNPFDAGESGAMKATKSPYDPRAKGLDGDMLDAMAKGRWQEGYGTGYDDGASDASSSYEQIYNDGFAAGRMQGQTEATAHLAAQLLPILQECGGAFSKISEKTGSAEIRAVCNEVVPRIRELLERHVGLHGGADVKVAAP